MLRRYDALIVILISLTLSMSSGILSGYPDQTESGPIQPSRADPAAFVNVSVEAGLEGISGNFFSWGDYDRDGYQDLLIDGRKLFRNNGPPSYHFTDQTDHGGISSSSNSGVFGDYDNDGWLDLFCGGGRGTSDHPQHDDILWHNERDGTFSRVPVSGSTPHDTFPTVASGWSDMNRDGWLDLYMVNYENSSYQGYADHFWIGDGRGGFVNSTLISGMSEGDHPYQGRGVSWCDFDNDGFQDAYVSNYRIMPNYLYRNNGNGSMAEVAREKGVEGHGNLHPVTRDGPYYGHSLGSSWGDMDNDGDMDLWVTNLAHKDIYRGPICDDSYLFENLGPGSDYDFRDVRENSGIPVKPLGGAVTEGDELMVSSSLADYDNDGDLDLFIPQIYGDVSYARSYFFSGNGDLTFQDITETSGIEVWNTYGSAWCDYNNDGWMDLVTGGGTWDSGQGSADHYSVHLYRNTGAGSGSGNQWLEVELHGRESNTAAIGARVHVEADSDGDGVKDLKMIRDVSGGSAAHGQQDSMIVHFGLGRIEGMLSARIVWPRGRVVEIDDVTPSTRLELFEPTDPINMDMKIEKVVPGGESVDVELMIDNHSPYTIQLSELDLLFNMTDGKSITRDHSLKDIGPEGQTIIRLNEDDIDFREISEVSITLERSFPPVAGDVGDVFIIGNGSEEPPIPVLSVPSETAVGEEIDIDGTSSYDPDGQVREYMFDFGDGTGTGWTDRGRTSHRFHLPGEYNISLEVRDDTGLISIRPDSSTILVLPGQSPTPSARILEISPGEAIEGEEVEFEGEGTVDEPERVTDYEWTSSLDGMLSRRSSFLEDGLSVGSHLISFRVRDSSGRWSDPDTGRVEVISASREPPWVIIDPLPGNGTLEGSLLVTGRAGPAEDLELVEIRIDTGPWRSARGTYEWEYLLDTRELDSGREHTLQARSHGDRYYSEIEFITFDVENEGKEMIQTADLSGDAERIPIIFIAGSAAMVMVVFLVIIISLLVRTRRASDRTPRMNPGGEGFKE
jgi:hypothetical protein